MAMTLLQMSAFREVMRLGSVSEAARALSRTQPAISAQIKSLEEELDCALFTRKGKRLVARPEAQYLLREAEQILGGVALVERNMRNLRHQLQGELNLLASEGPCATILAEIASSFIAERPQVQVSLTTVSPADFVATMAAQAHDIGLTDGPEAPQADLADVTETRLELQTLCAISPNDPLAKQSVITPNCLSTRAMGSLPEHHPITLSLKAAFQAAEAELNLRAQVTDPTLLLRFVARGQCCGVVNSLLRSAFEIQTGGQRVGPTGDISEIAFVPFSSDTPQHAWVLTPKHRPLSKLAEMFQKTLIEQLSNLG